MPLVPELKRTTGKVTEGRTKGITIIGNRPACKTIYVGADRVWKKVNRNVQEEPQAEVAANPWQQEEEKNDAD